MIYYRSSASDNAGPSLATLRTLIAVALLAYPVGCVVLALTSDRTSSVTHLA